ncbi:MAG: DUF4157 domain-containing protein [Saprospiraceae bacterium]|nr:DUF4157 domain-containing protein [Saprospiraceae bacterium]
MHAFTPAIKFGQQDRATDTVKNPIWKGAEQGHKTKRLFSENPGRITSGQVAINFKKVPVFANKEGGILQPKLKINAPNDKYEQEADQMAENVMRMSDNKFIQRKCAKCEEEEKNKIQMKGNTSVSSVSPEFQNHLNVSKNGGQPLPTDTNQFMSKAFGFDFSHVRIHDNEAAHQLNQKIHSKAFTYNSNIYFNKDQFSPASHEGKKLLAHELTHTVQQRPEIRKQPFNQFGPPPIDYDLITDPLERKLRMETDAKVIMWKDAMKRLEKGELTNEDLKNDRLMNRLTGLQSTEVIALIIKIKDFQKKKRWRESYSFGRRAENHERDKNR